MARLPRHGGAPHACGRSVRARGDPGRDGTPGGRVASDRLGLARSMASLWARGVRMVSTNSGPVRIAPSSGTLRPRISRVLGGRFMPRGEKNRVDPQRRNAAPTSLDSRTLTSQPRRTPPRAAARPTGPAPTITSFTFCGPSYSGFAASGRSFLHLESRLRR